MVSIKSLEDKALYESIRLMQANIEILRQHRGKKFLFRDLQPYLEAVESLKPAGNQSKTIFKLHKDSVKQHYTIFSNLTDSLGKREEPYTEHLQGTAILEILYELDPYLRSFTERFISQLDKSVDVILTEGERKHTGFYGPVCAADFALTPGSTANIINQVLRSMDVSEKERKYAHTLLAAKSWGMNTSYIFGWRFIDAVEAGRTKKEAAVEEIAALKAMFDKPIEFQTQLMREEKLFSFGVENYLHRYKEAMYDLIEEAVSEGIDYANILTIPALSVGDVGHHLCQSTYDLYADDYLFNMLEAVVDTVERNLIKQVGFRGLGHLLNTATGISAAAITYILESEGYTASTVNELLMKRFKYFISKYSYRGAGIEFHNVDFMDVIYRGDRILHRDNGRINNTEIDFSPLTEMKVIKDWRHLIYPNAEINRAFSALMRLADHFCLINIEPISTTLVTNIVAENPENPLSPIKTCKKCAASYFIPERCNYCERTKAI